MESDYNKEHEVASVKLNNRPSYERSRKESTTRNHPYARNPEYSADHESNEKQKALDLSLSVFPTFGKKYHHI